MVNWVNKIKVCLLSATPCTFSTLLVKLFKSLYTCPSVLPPWLMEISQQILIKDPRSFKKQDIESSLHKGYGKGWDHIPGTHEKAWLSGCPTVFRRHTDSHEVSLSRLQPAQCSQHPSDGSVGGECGMSWCLCIEGHSANWGLGKELYHFKVSLEFLVTNLLSNKYMLMSHLSNVSVYT